VLDGLIPHLREHRQGSAEAFVLCLPQDRHTRRCGRSIRCGLSSSSRSRAAGSSA
jgi:hypothetical protein